ncbi:unnamed protein product [Rhodiola kirilowii]
MCLGIIASSTPVVSIQQREWPERSPQKQKQKLRNQKMLAGVMYSGLVAAKVDAVVVCMRCSAFVVFGLQDKKLLDGGYNLQVAIHRVKAFDATKRF